MAAAPTRFAPAALDDGLVLTGTGERIVKIGFVVVNVYSAAFYVDSAAIAGVLSKHAGRTAEDLNGDEQFRREFVEAKVEKALRITLCRGLAKNKMTEAFGKALGSRVSSEYAEAAKEFVNGLIPDAGLVDNNIILVRLSADGETIEATLQENHDAEATPLVKVQSGGAGAIWECFQGIYFDNSTELPDVRRGFLQQLPSILADGAAKTAAEEPVEKETSSSEAASTLEAGERTLMKSRTWKDASGRHSGKDTYVFGDFCRSVRNKIRRKDGELTSSTGSDDEADLSKAKSELTAAQAELADATRQLEEVTSRLARADRSLQALSRRSPLPRVILVADALGLCLAFLAVIRRRPGVGARRLVAFLLMLSLASAGYLFRREHRRARHLAHRQALQASS